MSQPKWNPEVDGPRYKAHTNRFKKMRALARDITLQGTPGASPVRGLVANWWKKRRGELFAQPERFTPPKTDQGIFARISAHWKGDLTQGWPDPATWTIFVIATNAPDTFRWAYRRLKALGNTGRVGV